MSQAKSVYRSSPNEPLSETIVRAVADTKGVDPVELEVRLNDYLDPDALDRLFEPADAGTPAPDGLVVFTMGGCRIEVTGDRSVLVAPSRDDSSVAELPV